MSRRPASELLGAIGGARRDRLPPDHLVEVDPADRLVVYLESGEVLVTLTDSSGRETLCMHRVAGTFVGIEALQDARWPYQIWTLTAVELWFVSSDRFDAWLASHPHPTRDLVAATVGTLRLSIAERVALAGNATARVARYLAAASVSTRANALWPRRKNVLARILQMRPETFSRVLRRLEEAGAVRTEPRLEVVDAAVLERFMAE